MTDGAKGGGFTGADLTGEKAYASVSDEIIKPGGKLQKLGAGKEFLGRNIFWERFAIHTEIGSIHVTFPPFLVDFDSNFDGPIPHN